MKKGGLEKLGGSIPGFGATNRSRVSSRPESIEGEEVEQIKKGATFAAPFKTRTYLNYYLFWMNLDT
ncbi:MAG: hypothetical protein ACLFUR_06315 [Candidatus Hadarchaeia archaeon]